MKCLQSLMFAFCISASSAFAQTQDNQANYQSFAGTVTETMEGGEYTYMLITEGTSSQWVASRHMDVAVGDVVTVQPDMSMKNFKSPTLNRTFEHIIFAKDAQVGTNALETFSNPSSCPSNMSPKGTCPVTSSKTTSAPGITGEIIDTVNTEDYTYIQVRAPDKTVWAATSRFDAKIGDRVRIPDGMLMKNFESPTLKRTFDEIYFVDQVYPEGKPFETNAPSSY